jgi:hypothetical protein
MSFVFQDDERIVEKKLRPGEYRIGRVYDETSRKNLIYLRDEEGNSTLLQETDRPSPVSRFREGVQGSVKITYTEEGSIRLYKSKGSSNPVGAYVFKFDPNKFSERAFGKGEEFIPSEVFVGAIELPEEESGEEYVLPRGHGAKIFVYSPLIGVSKEGSKYYDSVTAFVGTVIS